MLRHEALIRKLSVKEKIRLCTGGDFWHTRALPKWDIVNQNQERHCYNQLRNPAIHSKNKQFSRLNCLSLSHQISIDSAKARVNARKQDHRCNIQF